MASRSRSASVDTRPSARGTRVVGATEASSGGTPAAVAAAAVGTVDAAAMPEWARDLGSQLHAATELHKAQAHSTAAQLAQMQAVQAQAADAQTELIRQLGDMSQRVGLCVNAGNILQQTVVDQGVVIDALKHARPPAPTSPAVATPAPKASSPGDEDDRVSQASQATTQIELALGVQDPTLHHDKRHCFLSTEHWRAFKRLQDQKLLDEVEVYQLNTIVGCARVLVRCQPLIADQDRELDLDIDILLEAAARNLGRILGRVEAQSKVAAEAHFAAWTAKRDAEENQHSIDGIVMPLPEMGDFYANQRREAAKKSELHKATAKEDRTKAKEASASLDDKRAAESKAHQRRVSQLSALIKEAGLTLPPSASKVAKAAKTAGSATKSSKKADGAPDP